MGLIVVGVDGSSGSLEALRFAVAEARLREAPLRVVHAWGFPASGTVSGSTSSAYAKLLDAARDGARKVLGEALEAVSSDTAGLEIEPVVVEGPPATVLAHESAGADLLVVGSRGHGGFVGLLLGSVGQQCAQHAPCAVAIVRPGA